MPLQKTSSTKDVTKPFFRPELLAPAGDLQKCATAFLYGADAVYLGGENFTLRASRGGFSEENLKQAVILAQRQQKKIYYTLNAFLLEQHSKEIPAHIESAAQAGVDAFIVADPGILRLVQHHAPQIAIHLSTQANVSNSLAASFWLEQGISRVNLARELDWRAIQAVRKTIPHAALEVFIHGAMCLAVSGQCLLSSWLNRRPANQGRCTQPCRFEYKALACSFFESKETEKPPHKAYLTVAEKKRQGEALWRIIADEAYSSFWAPFDLCLIDYLQWFIRNGINALKIEGRMKSSAYLAQVLDTYKTALVHETSCSLDQSQTERSECYKRELFQAASRPLSSGFFLPGKKKRLISPKNTQKYPMAAQLLKQAGQNSDAWLVEAKNNWDNTNSVEIILPGLRRPRLPAKQYSLENMLGEKISRIPSGSKGILRCQSPLLIPGLFLRITE